MHSIRGAARESPELEVFSLQRSLSRDRQPNKMIPANVTVYQDAGFAEVHDIGDDKLASLHQQMHNLRLECDRLINRHLEVENHLQGHKSSTLFPPESSSAYNTGGESCRSASITPDGTGTSARTLCVECCMPNHVKGSPSPQKNHKGSVPQIQRDGLPLPTGSNGNGLHQLRHTKEMRSLKDIPTLLPTALLFTSPVQSPIYATPPLSNENAMWNQPQLPRGQLHHSPRLLPKRDSWEYQAKKFRIPKCSIVARADVDKRGTSAEKEKNNFERQFALQNKVSNNNRTKENNLYMFDVPLEELEVVSDESEEEQRDGDDGEIAGPSQDNQERPVEYKWKVKRRCDGSRYVVKRPIRNQVLKKREAQLMKERTGISTDDDALSAVKLGHFCNRDERKNHLERERERRNKRAQKVAEASRAVQAEKFIVDLAQRKIAKKKQKTLLDGFTSTQEYLAQRHLDNASTPNGIFAITTV